MKKVIIVGGVAGGASAAARLRRLSEEVEIVLLEKGPYISFANCGLPYYIGEVITQRDQLLLQTPGSFHARFNVDVRIQSECIEVLGKQKKVRVKNHQTGEEYEESYDALILSPGSTPIVPPLKGIDGKNLFTLWNIPDTDRVYEFIQNNEPKSAVVIGGGFVGLEMVENLVERGIKVSLIEMQDQVMAPLDFDMAQIVHQELKEKGVELHLSTKVSSFSDKREKKIVHCEGGLDLETDFIILSLGVRPNTNFLKNTTLLDERGYIKVSDSLQTDDDSIYAVGDAIQVNDFISHEKKPVPLAGPANKQGRMVADIIMGRNQSFKGAQATSVAKIFDLDVATTGHNEKTLQARGLEYGKDYMITLILPKNHAGYYPGSSALTIKALYQTEDGKLLGTQVVGLDGVAKRVDVFATALRLGATVYDLTELELAYAPPYSSAKDPMNMVGYVSENILDGYVQPVHVQHLDQHKDAVLLDIRNEDELCLGQIEGSVHIPLDELRDRLDELDKEKEIIIYCAVGLRGYVGSRILTQNGFTKVYNLAGGYTFYRYYHGLFINPNISSCNAVAQEVSLKKKVSIPTGNEPRILNVAGLSCPGPIVQVANAIKLAEDGTIFEIHASDPGFYRDIPMWCESTGNTLLSLEKNKTEILALVQKADEKQCELITEIPHDKTLVVFSGDLDKAIASLIIANGAVSMGREVTMFFTFWGINILKKHQKVKTDKNVIERAFSMMLPRGTRKLKLSRMNFLGAGPKLIRKIMRNHRIDSIESLLEQAMKSGVKMIACNMSMDLLGIKEEELIDGVELGGVASYLGAAEKADTNLFI